jgi:hypothetical protein
MRLKLALQSLRKEIFNKLDHPLHHAFKRWKEFNRMLKLAVKDEEMGQVDNDAND